MSRRASSPPDELASQTALALLVLVPSLGQLAEDAASAAGAISTVQATHLHQLLGGPLRAARLAERLRTSRASVAEVLARLEAARLVRSAPDPDDGRARLVEVTPAGREAIEHFGRVTIEAVAHHVRRLPAASARALGEAARALFTVLTTPQQEDAR